MSGSPFLSEQKVFLAGGKKATINSLFANKKVVLVGYPGAFTYTCNQHIPEFNARLDELKSLGADSVVAVSVGDPEVMKAFGKTWENNQLTLIADWNAAFTKSIGKDFDMSRFGFGVRPKRFLSIVDNGVVKFDVAEKNPGKFENTGAQAAVKALSQSKL